MRDVPSRRRARSSAVTETTCGRPAIGIAVSKPTAGTVFAGARLDARLAGGHAPVRRLGAAVPARVDRHLAAATDRRDGRLRRRPPDPGVAERAVVPGVAVELRVEAHVAERPELRDVRLGAPADEHRVSAEHLGVAHRARRERGGMPVVLQHVRAHRSEVDAEPDRARLRGRRPGPSSNRVIVPSGCARASCWYMKNADGPSSKSLLRAAEPPEHLPARAVELVHAPRCCARRSAGCRRGRRRPS